MQRAAMRGRFLAACPLLTIVPPDSLCPQDAEAARCTPGQRAAMRERFLAACRMEWMFWDACYSLEAWPL